MPERNMADQVITKQELIDARTDAKSLEEVVNGNDTKQVTTRLGESYPSVKKSIKTMFENGGLPATPFATKALMTASDLVNGKYAVVTDESINSGLYFKEGGIWVRSDYDPVATVKEVADKLDLLVYNGANLEIINGEATQVGSKGFLKSPDFQRSDYIPITKGVAIRFKGVASSSTPIKGYDADKVFVKDLFVANGSRIFFDAVIEHEEGISYIVASSAYIAPNDPRYIDASPLIINMQSGVFSSLLNVDKELDINVVNGMATAVGDGGYIENEYYQCSEYIPVMEGAVYTFTGRASLNPIKAYDSNKNFLKDFYVRESTLATRAAFEKSVQAREGIRYLVASSYYKAEPDSAFQEVAPLKVRVSAENPDYTNKLLDYYGGRVSELEGMSSELEELSHSVEVLKDIINSSGSSGANGAFRGMTYNIYMGGRNATFRGLIKKHIRRVLPDFMTITEAGDIENLKPILQEFGLKYFYGTGGTYELFFASKTPILYSETVSSVDYARKPLYVELETGKGVIGVLSIHLTSACSSPTGLCHDEDYRNVEPWEPRAQQRTIQMYQIMDFFNRRKAENPSLKGFVMQGDYNQAHDEKNLIEYISPTDESYLPEGLSYPLPNAQFPVKQFEYYTGDMRLITNPSANGLDYTWWGSDKSPNPIRPNYEIRLDYISYSDDIELVDAEILNSESDSVMPNAGIRKYGEPLAESDSYTASDHAPVVADFIIR